MEKVFNHPLIIFILIVIGIAMILSTLIVTVMFFCHLHEQEWAIINDKYVLFRGTKERMNEAYNCLVFDVETIAYFYKISIEEAKLKKASWDYLVSLHRGNYRLVKIKKP